MILGLPWTSWLLLVLGVGLGLALSLSFYLAHRQDDANGASGREGESDSAGATDPGLTDEGGEA